MSLVADVLEGAAIFPIACPMSTVLFVAAFGLCAGSFANVCIYRLPRYCLSIVKPGSFCPACETPIRWYDNIPVLSWALWLRARCRACGVVIPVRYPLVELLTGILFGALAWRVLLAQSAGREMVSGQQWFVLAVWAALGTALIIASVIDIQMRIIPDVISVGGVLLLLVLAPLLPLIHDLGVSRELVGDPLWFSKALAPWQRVWLTSVAVAGCAGLGLWLIGKLGALLAPKAAREAGGGMGFGDVKLVVLLALALGWPKLLLAFGLAVCFGALVGMPRLLRKWRGEQIDSAIPFGPFLSLGAIAAMLFSDTAFRGVMWYLDLVGGRTV